MRKSSADGATRSFPLAENCNFPVPTTLVVARLETNWATAYRAVLDVLLRLGTARVDESIGRLPTIGAQEVDIHGSNLPQ